MLVRLIISLVCATPLYYLDVFKLRENFEQAIPVHCFVLSVLIVLVVARKQEHCTRFTDFERVFLIYLLYTVVRTAFLKDWDIRELSLQVLATALYFTLKEAFSQDKQNAYKKYVCINLMILFFILIAISIGQIYIQSSPMRTFFLPNSSAFGIYLAILFAALLPLFYKWLRSFPVNRLTAIGFIGIAFGALVVVWFNSRAGWIGLFAAILCLYFTSNTIGQKRKSLFLVGTFLLLGFAAGLYFYKKKSSEGRMLILQVSKSIINDNPIWGVGTSKFQVTYPEYQAAYFKQNGIDSPKALLADNTFFAFNDLFQVAVEQGLIGLLLIGTSIVLFARKVFRESKYSSLEKGCIAGLVCFCVTTLFFYSAHLFPVLLLVTLFFGVVNAQKFPNIDRTNSQTGSHSIIKMGIVSVVVVLIIHFWNWFKYESKARSGIELLASGFRTRADQDFLQIRNSYLNDGKTMVIYSRSMYNRQDFRNAKAVLDLARNRIKTNELYILKGDIETAMGNIKSAEQSYLTAVHMIPNRMRPRLLLAQFYSARLDPMRAKYWAKSVLNMNVKVNSPQTDFYREKAKAMLEQ